MMAPSSNVLKSLLAGKSRALLFGMIHLPALPGTPLSKHSVQEIVAQVQSDAALYAQEDVDGLIVENMHDVPYMHAHTLQPETTAVMTRACLVCAETVKQKRSRMALGVQVLAGGNLQAMAVAHAAGFDFIRAECFVFSHVADEGLMHASAGALMRYRKQIGAQNVAILADIKKKHCSHAITADLDVADVAEAAQFFLADGVIVTGSATGQPANPTDIADIRSRNNNIPIFIGSGITAQNVGQYAQADGFIVGSHFKHSGQWQNSLDANRIRRLVKAVSELPTVRKKTKSADIIHE